MASTSSPLAKASCWVRGGELSQGRLLDDLPLGVCICDRQGHITQHNRRAVEVWGRTPAGNGGGDRFTGALRIYDANGRRLAAGATPIAVVLHTGLPLRNRELIIERQDSTRITLLSNIAPLQDECGSLLGAVDVFHDITECKRSEEARRVAERLAASARLASGLARQMQVPIASMNDLLERLCQDSSLSTQARGYAESAQQELLRLVRIAKDALGTRD